MPLAVCAEIWNCRLVWQRNCYSSLPLPSVTAIPSVTTDSTDARNWASCISIPRPMRNIRGSLEVGIFRFWGFWKKTKPTSKLWHHHNNQPWICRRQAVKPKSQVNLFFFWLSWNCHVCKVIFSLNKNESYPALYQWAWASGCDVLVVCQLEWEECSDLVWLPCISCSIAAAGSLSSWRHQGKSHSCLFLSLWCSISSNLSLWVPWTWKQTGNFGRTFACF